MWCSRSVGYGAVRVGRVLGCVQDHLSAPAAHLTVKPSGDTRRLPTVVSVTSSMRETLTCETSMGGPWTRAYARATHSSAASRDDI